MKTGTVKWFNSAKGYGFITPDEGERDLFVHYSDVQMEGYRNLEQGQRVSYQYCDGAKGPHADQVTALDKPETTVEHKATEKMAEAEFAEQV